MARSRGFGDFLDSDNCLKELCRELFDGEDERLGDDVASGEADTGIDGDEDDCAGCLGRCSCLSSV